MTKKTKTKKPAEATVETTPAATVLGTPAAAAEPKPKKPKKVLVVKPNVVLEDTQLLRSYVRGVYDLQKLRIQTGARVVAIFRQRLGLAPNAKAPATPISDEKQKKEDESIAKEILVLLRAEYKRVTDGVVAIGPSVGETPHSAIIAKETEMNLIKSYLQLEADERAQFAGIDVFLERFPIVNEFLYKIRGVGPAMAGVLMSELDIHKARYVSSFWKYAGLDVVHTESGWVGRSRHKECQVVIQYTDKKGQPAEKMGISFNPFLKSKLYVLGSSLLRAKSPVYSQVYQDYKHRIANMPEHASKEPKHRHNMAVRYMLKIFLQHLFIAWKQVEGLPVPLSYQESKLGHTHGVTVEVQPTPVEPTVDELLDEDDGLPQE